MKFTPLDVTDLTDELARRRRRAKVSETRGGSFLVLAGGSGVIATHTGGTALLWLAIFLMCIAVAFLAAAEVVKELRVDGDE